MGPTSRAPLPARAAAGKAVGEVARIEAAADRPVRRDGGEGLENKAAPVDPGMRDGQPPGPELAAAPQDEIEIEHARAPSAAVPAAERTLDLLELRKHRWRTKLTLDDRDGVGEVASCAAMRRIEDDRRGVEQPEVLVQPGDCGLDDSCRPAEAAMRAVRPNRDRVKVRCVRHAASPRSRR